MTFLLSTTDVGIDDYFFFFLLSTTYVGIDDLLFVR